MRSQQNVPGLGVGVLLSAVFMWGALAIPQVGAQMPSIRYGDRVSPEVKIIYDRGVKYLAKTQQPSGSWAGGQVGGGVTGLCLMAFLASGEDPNFGQYSVNVRRAVANIFRIAPPLTVTRDQIDTAISILDQALTECAA